MPSAEACPTCNQQIKRDVWLQFTLEQVHQLPERFEAGGIIGYSYAVMDDHITGEVTYAPGVKERFYALR